MSLYKQARSLPKRFRLVLALQNAGDGSQGDVDPGAPGLAYNPIRQTMLQAARKAGMSPRALRFAAAVQSIAASWLVIVLRGEALAARLINAALASMEEHIVGNRPGRFEPRAVKRRAKPHDLLTKPRAQARAEMIGAKSP